MNTRSYPLCKRAPERLMGTSGRMGPPTVLLSQKVGGPIRSDGPGIPGRPSSECMQASRADPRIEVNNPLYLPLRLPAEQRYLGNSLVTCLTHGLGFGILNCVSGLSEYQEFHQGASTPCRRFRLC